MREIKSPPVMEESKWALVRAYYCHMILSEDNKSFHWVYSEKLGPNCVGVMKVFVFLEDVDVVCRELNFFNKGVMLKFWGFVDDFKNNGQNVKVALLADGKWFRKEDGDDFHNGGIFDSKRRITSVILSLSNQYKAVEAQISL